MRTLDELGISPAPWKNEGHGIVSYHKVEDDGIFVLTKFNTDANARLIASAPMLYEALREAVIESCHECMEKAKCCPHKFDNGCFVTKWRDALAAASGESEVAK